MSSAPDPPHLPDQTSDDLDVGWGDDREEDDGSRLLDDLPPHHVDRD